MTAILAAEIAGPPRDGGVMVLLRQIDGGRDQHGPCSWQPRADVEPKRGDRCVVIEDDRGGLWVAGWEPS